MRIVWNLTENRFEAQFDQGSNWLACKDAVSAAGFKTAGPPTWTWFSIRSLALTKLRENRPVSGLTITPEALEKYNSLKVQDEANLAVKAEYQKVRKALKKEQQLNERCATGPQLQADPELGECFKVEPGESRIWNKPVVPPPPTILCHICRTPVYAYELQDPPTCLDCEFPEKST